MMSGGPPIIDFSLYGLDKTQENLSDEELRPLAQKLLDAMSDTGLVYLVNHGIDPQALKAVNACSKDFFNLPQDTKEKYTSFEECKTFRLNGYVPAAKESVQAALGEGDDLDILESMHIRQSFQKKWPDEDVPAFRSSTMSFFKRCATLSYRAIKLLCLSMDYQDRDYLLKFHQFEEGQDPSDMKLIHYFPVTEELPADRMRLAAHHDFTSVSLIFQDDIGGLEYKARDGTWLSVPPVKDSVVFLIGHNFQVWTADKLLAPVHRVAIPADPMKRKQSRFSVTYFANPKPDSTLKCLDGSDKYKPMTFMELIEQLFSSYFKL